LHSYTERISKEEVLGRTNSLLSPHKTRAAQKKKNSRECTGRCDSIRLEKKSGVNIQTHSKPHKPKDIKDICRDMEHTDGYS
jgi:hypothetical protein